MGRLQRRVSLLVLLMLMAQAGHAQYVRLSAWAMQAGFNPAAVSSADALFLNPAALMNAGVTGPRLRLMEVGGWLGGSLVRFDLYNQYLTGGRHLTSADVDQMLDAWFGDAKAWRTVGEVVEITPLALTYTGWWSAWGVAWRVRQQQRLWTNRGVLDVLLKGTEEPRTLPVNGEFRSMTYHELVVGYARKLNPDLIVGIAPRLLLGSHYVGGVMRSMVSIKEDEIQHRYTYTLDLTGATETLLEGFDLFDNPKLNGIDQWAVGRQMAGLRQLGWGAGLALGVQYRLLPGLLFGVSLTDLGFLRWKRVRRYTPRDSVFTFAGVQLDVERLRTEFNSDLGAYVEHQLDSLARAAYEEVNVQEAGVITLLPATVHLGTTYWIGGATRLHAALSLGVNRAGVNARAPQLVLGAETRLAVLPLFGGMVAGGDGALMFYGGTGLQVRTWGIRVAAAGTPRSYLMGSGARFMLMVSLMHIGF
ncbi:DUF5723 family protein [Rhodothermus profundi]|uniref:DUF5723 domain-containing protein n=1 Tax=Rhodothermus profundi TaxID=633813 RepID=A0A1M6PFB0_9BACT|nr:DUF5723 family protein [Rhodothermus profundi]SHK06582.1 hypothetical protein SAMN04488087_0159 [Rhodothermus profundi]